MGRHLGWLYFLAIEHRLTINMGVLVSLWYDMICLYMGHGIFPAGLLLPADQTQPTQGNVGSLGGKRLVPGLVVVILRRWHVLSPWTKKPR